MPSNPTPTGVVTNYTDNSHVSNRFDGPQLGTSCGVRYGSLSLDLSAKLGVGLLHADAGVHGATTQQTADGTIKVTDGGVLAVAGVSGSFGRDWFCVTPEVGVSLGYQVTPWLRAAAGYDFLYVSRLARSAALLTGGDSRQVPQLPSFDPASRGAAPGVGGQSFWAQGLQAGLEFRY